MTLTEKQADLIDQITYDNRGVIPTVLSMTEPFRRKDFLKAMDLKNNDRALKLWSALKKAGRIVKDGKRFKVLVATVCSCSKCQGFVTRPRMEEKTIRLHKEYA